MPSYIPKVEKEHQLSGLLGQSEERLGESNPEAGAKLYSLCVKIPKKLTTHSSEVEEKHYLGKTPGPEEDIQ